jgi:uncharacterized protein (UPF0332 family)
VKPEATLFLEKARTFLEKADGMLSTWPDEAGRAAYLAGFHAAQAFIFEAIGRTPKTHNGVQTEFLRLTKDDPRLDPKLRAFLSTTYNLKTIADYEAGPGFEVSPERAADAIKTAMRFVVKMVELIG